MHIVKKHTIPEQVIDIRKVSIEVKNIFRKFNFDTIFVTEEDKLVGVISQGNCKRAALYQKGELVTKNFTYVQSNQEEKIEQIFYNNHQIIDIPVLNQQGKLCYYYSNERSESEKNISGNIRNIIKYYKNKTYYDPNNLLNNFGIEKCFFIRINSYIDEVIQQMIQNVIIIENTKTLLLDINLNMVVIDLLADNNEVLQNKLNFHIMNSDMLLHI